MIVTGAMVLLLVGAGVLLTQSSRSEDDRVDTESAVGELQQFTDPPGTTSSPAVVAPCEEGLSPHAVREFTVLTSSIDDAAADLARQAVHLGWTPVDRENGAFRRGGLLLVTGGWDSEDSSGAAAEGVTLSVVLRADC